MALSKIDVANMLTGATPVANGGTALTSGFTNGFTGMADVWRVTSGFTNSADPIASNWERADTYGFGKLGTGMTESSGIFTYPSTGIYNVTFVAQLSSPNTANGIRFGGGQIQTTANNSSYDNAASNYNAVYYNPNGFASTTTIFMHDVADVSNDKIRFICEHDNDGNAAATFKGSTSYNYTYATFIRLGDT